MSDRDEREAAELDALTRAILLATDLDEDASRDLAVRVQGVVNYERGIR